MKGLTKIEPPQQGHDIRSYGSVLKAVCDRLNLLWTVKPKGEVKIGENGIMIDLTDLAAGNVRVKAIVIADDATVSAETVSVTGAIE